MHALGTPVHAACMPACLHACMHAGMPPASTHIVCMPPHPLRAHFICACVSASLACMHACMPLHAETHLAPVPAPKGEHGGRATDEMRMPFHQAERGTDHML
jgi:hypothetical protein